MRSVAVALLQPGSQAETALEVYPLLPEPLLSSFKGNAELGSHRFRGSVEAMAWSPSVKGEFRGIEDLEMASSSTVLSKRTVADATAAALEIAVNDDVAWASGVLDGEIDIEGSAAEAEASATNGPLSTFGTEGISLASVLDWLRATSALPWLGLLSEWLLGIVDETLGSSILALECLMSVCVAATTDPEA